MSCTARTTDSDAMTTKGELVVRVVPERWRQGSYSRVLPVVCLWFQTVNGGFIRRECFERCQHRSWNREENKTRRCGLIRLAKLSQKGGPRRWMKRMAVSRNCSSHEICQDTDRYGIWALHVIFRLWRRWRRYLYVKWDSPIRKRSRNFRGYI